LVTSDEYAPPPGFVELAHRLDLVAAAVHDYKTTEAAPWPDSISARELAEERDFLALPRKHPMMDTQLAPRQYLGSAADHLTAFAAVIRAPHTVMALLTLLRTQIVGAAYAAYVAEPDIGARERVRRWLNVHLDSLTEQMRLVGRDDAESAEHYDELEQRRRDVKSGAHQLGWTIAGNDTPKSKAWPVDWCIKPRPTEMDLVNDLLSGVDAPGKTGKTLYRFLSATTHAQPHALLALIDSETARSHGDGSATVSTRLDGHSLLVWAMVATGSLTVAIDKCCRLYGWPPERWIRDVVSFFNDIRSQLGVPQLTRGVRLLG
jgi:hypothetical protein